MATECYDGSIPLHPQATTLPLLPTARCVPEGGICYSSLSRGEGQATAQLGCWPSQTASRLAWPRQTTTNRTGLGVPECKNEFGRLVCLCLETLCNGFLPRANENSPEGGDLQGLAMMLLALLLLVMLGVVTWSLVKLIKRHAMKLRGEEEHGQDNPTSYMQREPGLYQISPYYNFPSTPPNSCGSPAPLLRMSSAPASLTVPRPSQSGDSCTQSSLDRTKDATNNNGPSGLIDMARPIAKDFNVTNIKTYTKPRVKRLDLGGGSPQNWAFSREEKKFLNK
eukprot:GFUD01019540.1.p1 GENE.GFUD01019540.1~~GFUD01019540.1.p1  ORF type:complete len:281 (+),score=67.90 GFUD01019540.1:204-1046(+)